MARSIVLTNNAGPRLESDSDDCSDAVDFLNERDSESLLSHSCDQVWNEDQDHKTNSISENSDYSSSDDDITAN